ncbi:Mov34/MPN/PAD-1 family protein [Pectobacterium versatile]|uniref:Mov34/MPN/PAD-1 family protein n=2 Tax=Enterobacterales TaxID=91347 RepID=UPI0019699787|nr:Mov34/MPN/PAD-1 family protein [Pectobacterium versatile]MBP1131125.1 proteasome lid subunit RPN8/RPN11 [Serratia sp. PL17]
MNILSRCLMALSSENRMSIKDVTFSSDGATYTVVLSSSTINQMVSECLKAGVNETGGILIGSYSEDSSTAMIEEATTRPADSLAGRTTFQRGVKGLRSILRARWKTGLYYVGEWHFHPGGSPEPSRDDLMSMTSIAATPGYQCLEPIMIILGGDPTGSYSLSASVFPRGDSPIRLREMLI